MKTNKYILLIALSVTLSFLLSTRFYQKNVTAMQAQAEELFVATLKSELHKKVVEENLPYSFTASSDTIPLTICIRTEQGEKVYKVDPTKSRRNISQQSIERSLHTIVCEENPLSADSLNRRWADTLRTQNIYARTAMRVSAVTLQDKTVVSTSPGYVVSSPRFVSYIGNRCEIEVIGCVAYSWWAVCLFDWFPFLWSGIGVLSAFFLLCFFYRLTHRPPEIEVVKEEVVREVIKEVPVPVCVKEIDNVNLKIYQLQSNFLFDAHKQVLVWNGVEKALAPQSCIILRTFLDATDYTLTDTEILHSVWGKKDTSIKTFTAACARLRNSLREVGYSVLFKRVGSNQYRMIVL